MLNKALLDQLQAALDAHNDDNTHYMDALGMYHSAVKATIEALAENWQYDAVVKLLETPRKEMEPGKRFYFSSPTYGTGFYHMVDRRYDSIQIEQVDIDEKWNKRVNLYQDEIPGLLACLLTWHLEQVKDQLEQDTKSNDDMGSIDDHPF